MDFPKDQTAAEVHTDWRLGRESTRRKNGGYRPYTLTVGSVPNRSWGDEPIYDGVMTLLGAMEGPGRTAWDPRFAPPPRKVGENTGGGLDASKPESGRSHRSEERHSG